MTAALTSAAFLPAASAAAATRRHRQQLVVTAGQGFASKPAKAVGGGKKASDCTDGMEGVSTGAWDARQVCRWVALAASTDQRDQVPWACARRPA